VVFQGTGNKYIISHGLTIRTPLEIAQWASAAIISTRVRAPRIQAAAIIRGWQLFEGDVWFCEVLRVTSHHARWIFVVTRIRSILCCRWSYVHNRDRAIQITTSTSKCSHPPVSRLVRSILRLLCLRNLRTACDEPAAEAWQRGLPLKSTRVRYF